MIIQSSFQLIKDTPNIMNLSSATLKPYTIDNGPRRIFVEIARIENRIAHFSKDYIMSLVEDIDRREILKLINMPKYLLPVSYNENTNNIIINLIPLGSSDISRIDSKNIYASVVYGISFYKLIKEITTVKINYAEPIINFLLSIFIRLFGKQYGLLGVFMKNIPKLKFLLGCYIYTSFFDLKDKKEIYKKSSTISNFNFNDIGEELDQIDFSHIKDFIDSLDTFKVMPGMNIRLFLTKFHIQFGNNFLPALEDLSRFMATVITSSLTGTNVVPTFISKYNITEYTKLMEIGRGIFS